MINRNTNAFRFYIVPTKRDRRHQIYSVIFNGRIVIQDTPLPSAAGCRYLASLGLTGRAEMCDFERPYARMVFSDLVEAGQMRVEEPGNRRSYATIDRYRREVAIHEGFEIGMDNHPSQHERLFTVA
ncbi:hypothetical protein [Sinorhizobium fredii]|uniref:hypothetical protein n=1 Tax=Rhizobium fredii TaxID=380 RepID=UPI003517C2A5